MSNDLETQVHQYATFMDSTMPTFEADQVIAGRIELQAPSAFGPERRRDRRGWALGLATALAIVGAAVVVGTLSGVLSDSSAPVASGGSPLVVAARYYEAYNSQDGAALADLFADDIVLSFPGISFGPFVGKNEVLAEQLDEITNDPVITLSDPIADGDTVRGAHSFAIPGHVYSGTVEIVVDKGKITRITVSMDEESVKEFQRG